MSADPDKKKPDLSAKGWQIRYDENKTGWDRGESNPMLLDWMKIGELQPCRILIPGCGRGYEVLSLAEAGFDVTAVDFAVTPVNHLNRELERLRLKADIVQADFFSYQPDHRFDAVYDQTCLCALNPELWESYEQRLRTWLRPGGKLLALFMQSGQNHAPPYSCEIAKMQSLFPTNRWLWKTQPCRVEHPSGLHELGCILESLP